MSVKVASEAEARRYAEAAGAKFPKPVPVLKVRKPLARSMPPTRKTPIKRSAAPKRKKGPTALSELKRKENERWPGIRRAIYDREGAICQLCRSVHDAWTAHHLDKKRTGFDAETGMVMIGLATGGGGFSGCHRAAHNDLRASRLSLGWSNAKRYECENRVRWLVSEEWPEQLALNQALTEVQREIDAGRLASRLRRPKGEV